MPEPGGAATFVRRAFNDPAGFATGWVLFLDYVVVIALAALFVPHYLGERDRAGTRSPTAPGTSSSAIVVIGAAHGRPPRPARAADPGRRRHRGGRARRAGRRLRPRDDLPLLDRCARARDSTSARRRPRTNFLFALSVAALAYTGVETVANLAAEAREPGRTLPAQPDRRHRPDRPHVRRDRRRRHLRVSGPPRPGRTRADGRAGSARTGCARPSYGISVALDASLPGWAADVLRVFVGVTGALVLVGAIVTSIAGAGRLAYSLGPATACCRMRSAVSARGPPSPRRPTIAVAAIAAVLLAARRRRSARRCSSSRASTASAIFIAFTAAQLAVVGSGSRSLGSSPGRSACR